jgi:hypothetical protein
MSARGVKGSLQLSVADTRPPPPEEEPTPIAAAPVNGSASQAARKYLDKWLAKADTMPGETLGGLAEHLKTLVRQERRGA